MKTKIAFGCVLSALLFACVARPLWSGDEEAKREGAEMPEAMQPGPEHEVLAKLAGKWDVATRVWMAPDAEPVAGKASAEMRTIMDGRYVQQDYQGEMMGAPFTGMEIIGYDRVMKKFTAHWIDSMGTSASFLTGTSKDGGKTIEFKGKMSDPEAGGELDTRWVHTEKSGEEFVFEMYLTIQGKEVKFMELTYRRKK